jgi:N-acetylglucosaminyldiphosphoundecaprenol N-acetyl-beta-D-mannosaminyltransferase
MRKTTDILGVNIDVTDMQGALETICEFIKDDKGAKAIYTPNPEFIMMAKEDENFRNILNSSDLVIADGIGIVIASKLLKKDKLTRVTGFETTKNLFKLGSNGNISFYLLCGAPGVAEIAAQKIKEQYPMINIVGTHHGYFKENEDTEIIGEINRLHPDVLFVGLGAPKQEKWIYNNKSKLNVKVCMGIGGTFDIFAGKAKEPPKIIQKVGLWWLYRLITQPTRAKRMLNLPKFVLCVLKQRFRKQK